MISHVISAEKRRARSIAEDYRIRGYAVVEEPSQEQLPDFLAGYSPTILAYKEGESAESLGDSVAVLVKARQLPGKERRVGELADLLRNKPGWKFELALVEADGLLDIVDAARPFDREDIRQCQDEAESLLNAGFKEASLLRAWAGVEATVRLLLEEDGLMTEEEDISPDRLASTRLLGSAVYYGVMSQEDYLFLTEAMRLRNACVHGFALQDCDSALVTEIIGTSERLFREAASSTLPAF